MFPHRCLALLAALSGLLWIPSAHAEESATEEPSAAGPFAAGTRTFQLYGGHNFGDPGKGEMWSGHLGLGYHPWDDIGIHLEAFGAFVRSGIDDDGVAAGADLIGRWHVLHTAGHRVGFFLDAAAGLQQQSTDYSGSRRFNFRLHPGVGLTAGGRGLRLLTGARYLHISDAGVAGSGGGGFDGLYLYLGTISTW